MYTSQELPSSSFLLFSSLLIELDIIHLAGLCSQITTTNALSSTPFYGTSKPSNPQFAIFTFGNPGSQPGACWYLSARAEGSINLVHRLGLLVTRISTGVYIEFHGKRAALIQLDFGNPDVYRGMLITQSTLLKVLLS